MFNKKPGNGALENDIFNDKSADYHSYTMKFKVTLVLFFCTKVAVFCTKDLVNFQTQLSMSFTQTFVLGVLSFVLDFEGC